MRWLATQKTLHGTSGLSAMQTVFFMWLKALKSESKVKFTSFHFISLLFLSISYLLISFYNL